jgi:hypothetical protein
VFTVPLGRVVVVIANGAGETVSTVVPVIPFCVAEIVVFPTETAVARPDDALIVARAGTEEVHPTCAVMFNVLPSE